MIFLNHWFQTSGLISTPSVRTKTFPITDTKPNILANLVIRPIIDTIMAPGLNAVWLFCDLLQKKIAFVSIVSSTMKRIVSTIVKTVLLCFFISERVGKSTSRSSPWMWHGRLPSGQDSVPVQVGSLLFQDHMPSTLSVSRWSGKMSDQNSKAGFNSHLVRSARQSDVGLALQDTLSVWLRILPHYT